MASSIRPMRAKTSATLRRAARSCGSSATAFLNSSSAAGSFPLARSAVPRSFSSRDWSTLQEYHLDRVRAPVVPWAHGESRRAAEEAGRRGQIRDEDGRRKGPEGAAGDGRADAVALQGPGADGQGNRGRAVAQGERGPG